MADYITNWVQLLTVKEIQQKVKDIAKALYYKFYKVESMKPVVLTCILKGASIFTTDVLKELTGLVLEDHMKHLEFAKTGRVSLNSLPPIPQTPTLYFIEASSYHDAQTQSKEVEILSLIKPDKFEGRQIVLLDELCDNGKTLEVVKQHILKEVPSLVSEDVYTCVMFTKNYRDKSRKYPLPNLTGFMIPDVWLVGYGLDNNQQLRGLGSLWAKPKQDGVPKTPADDMFESKYHASAYVANIKKDLLTYN